MKFGIIVSTRAFFPGSLALTARETVCTRLEALGHSYVIIDESETKFGAIESYSDAEKCAELFKAHREEIEGILVVLPNFGDEVAVCSTITLAKLDVPVLLMAADDETDKMDLAHRRDAFCGKLSVAANFYQAGVKFTNTTLHTIPLDSEKFDSEIDRFMRICRVVNGMRSARIGAIGTRPDAFRTVRYSEKLLQRSGITTSVIDMSDMLTIAKSFGDDDAVIKEKIAELKAYANMNSECTDKKLLQNAKLLAAIEKWTAEKKLDAYAFQCWDSLEYNHGCAPCLSMSLLAEKGLPGACEMDVMGAVTMYAVSLASGEPSGYLDWNNSFTDDRDKCVCLHCSSFPKSFMGTEMEVGSLDVLGTTIDRELCFGACKGRVQPGEFTFAKVSTDDLNGKIKFYAGKGEFVADDAYTPGGFAVCKVNGLQKLMNYMVKNGFEHHVCMARGNVTEILNEALCGYMGWEGYLHEEQ